MKALMTAVVLLGLTSCAMCDTSATIRVFIALCDNKTQGIVPVGEKIGNGDKPDENLYWGCSEGFGKVFPRSAKWEVVKSEKDVSHHVMRRMKLRHVPGGRELIVEAYRGAAIRQCLIDFERAVASGQHELVAYIGHNGLMDFNLPEMKPPTKSSTDVVVLCCLSDRYFRARLRRLGARPILLTTQLMYPASSVLHDVIEKHLKGAALKEFRMAAAKAYAANQNISVKAAAGVFALGND